MKVEDFRLPVTKPDQYPDEKRVRLRGDRTGVYTLARAGSEGWIRARRYDALSAHRMVFVEWDPEHWSYNAQPNMWTFEDHFELVNEDQVMSQPSKDDLNKALGIIASAIGADAPDDEKTDTQDHEPDLVPQAEDGDFYAASDDQYLDVLKNAVSTARRAEAFLIVAVTREPNPVSEDSEVLVPQIFKSEKTEDAMLLNGLHVAQVGAMFHADLAVDRIKEVLASNDPEPPELI